MRFYLLIALVSARILALGSPEGPYEWIKDRQRYSLTEKEKALNEYILKYHREYRYDWENDELVVYMTEHRITHVVNSEAIQRHNRIYISLRNVLDVVTLRARSINKDGKVVTFDKTNLKEVKDEDTNNSYKIFAVEGIESDSEIEYFYTLKMTKKLYETAYYQFEMPIKEASLRLTSPSKLIFDFRVYHDTSHVRSDTLDGRNRYVSTITDIPGLAKEKFSYFDTNRKRIEIKLAYNTTSSTARLNTWPDAAKSFYKSIVRVDDDSQKLGEKFAKTLGDNKEWTPVNRIKNIEDKIKNSIKIVEQASESAHGSIPDILKYKQASVQGITSLFSVVFESLGIPYQIVVTCNRETAKFDGGFDSWSYLDDYLLYFPQTHGFLSPNENELRYPLIPAKYTGNNGLFIEPIRISNVKSALGSIREIPVLPFTADTDDLDILVKFDATLETNTITQKRTFTGYDAAYMTTYYALMTPEQKEKFVDELMRPSVPDIKMIKWSAASTVVDELPRFELMTTFTTNYFVDKAGKKVLFKVGELIGPQTELYRDDKRMTDVENADNRGYRRTIQVEVPSGYKIGNANGLKMEVSYKDGDSVPFLFSSDYSLEKTNLKIILDEFYKQIYAPISRYEDFRRVVNASADFNKVTLVLESPNP